MLNNNKMSDQEYPSSPEIENPLLTLCDAAYHGDIENIKSILSERENRYLVNEFLNFDEQMGEVR